jgi:hypothetical protein
MNVTVKSRSDLDKSTQTDLEVVELNTGSRVMRGLKGMGICWAIAVFCVLIPVVHLIAPVLFLLLGMLMFVQQWGQKFYLMKGSIKCPSCEHEMTLQEGAFDWPKREICGECRRDLTIHPNT